MAIPLIILKDSFEMPLRLNIAAIVLGVATEVQNRLGNPGALRVGPYVLLEKLSSRSIFVAIPFLHGSAE
jgi:hypothetical protein